MKRSPARQSVKQDWQVQTAKARFSELFRKARTEGPQRITKQGKEAVVMLSAEEYEKLAPPPKQQMTLVEFLQRSPLRGVKLDLERNKSLSRDIDL